MPSAARWHGVGRPSRQAAAALAILLAACSEGGGGLRKFFGEEPVELPALLSTELPFEYPPGLYIEQIQDDVTLQLYLDAQGIVVPESIKVEEPSKYALFDSAAVEGAPKLMFRPARRGDRTIPYTVLFPIKFRVPNGPPLPQDTISPSRKEQ